MPEVTQQVSSQNLGSFQPLDNTLSIPFPPLDTLGRDFGWIRLAVRTSETHPSLQRWKPGRGGTHQERALAGGGSLLHKG